MKEYFNLMAENKYFSSGERLKFYLNYLFKGVSFKDKTLIDIGGGNGLFSFYCATNGAKAAVVMEPEFEGSSNGMIQSFYKIKSLLGNPSNIEHTSCVLEDYKPNRKTFDIILMHNSINHIDEISCASLMEDAIGKEKYLKFFKLLREIAHDNTILIVCDCARSNFFGDLGIPNRYAPTIEWKKHQNPEVWNKLLADSGFSLRSIEWTSPNILSSFGRLIFGNRCVAYFTSSHFKLIFTAKTIK